MCGISGFWQPPGATNEQLTACAMDMACTLSLRGPDDAGEWVDTESGVAFGFRRLSILDLSPAGHQPMHSADGRYVLMFNGEVYNFQVLRGELEQAGRRFRSSSDSEVIVEAISAWGLPAAVRRFTGMFALAVWDTHQRQLSLVRDRMGIKPLYYGWMGSTFLFGSEIKALRRHPAFQPEVDRGSLTLMMRYNVIPAPHTIYHSVYALMPGSILTLSSAHPTGCRIDLYWSVVEKALEGQAQLFEGSPTEATDQLEDLLKDAVGLRMIADVPLGAFLSGGTDSSTVVALMQAQSSRPVKTFTIGFYDSQYDEARYARQVAEYFGTDHTELYVTPDDALEVIPNLPNIFDEPFSDTSQIPTYLVARLARQQVTVSLSGDGGDELFAGYSHYPRLLSAYRRLTSVPHALRAPVGYALEDLGRLNVARLPRHRLRKYGQVLSARTLEDIYRWSVSYWRTPGDLVLGSHESPTVYDEASRWSSLDPMHRMTLIDMLTYLPNDILTKLDRVTMAVSLEARVPLLDHRVVEFAWRLPLSYKYRQGEGKWILKQVLHRYIPPELVDRPKKGFSLPVARWLRGALRPWAEELLSEERLQREGYFNPDAIRAQWSEHLSGKKDRLRLLWNVLMFQAWKERWMKR